MKRALAGLTLRGLTAIYLALFLMATVVTGLATYSATIRTIRNLVDQRLSHVSESLAPDGGRLDRQRLIAQIDALSRQRDTGDLGIALFDEEGRWIGGNVRLSRRVPMGFSGVSVADKIEGLSKGRALARRLGDGTVLVAIAEMEPFDNYDLERQRIYLIGFGSIILIVVGGTSLFSRVVHRRITRIHSAADAIFDGDMSYRVPVSGSKGAFDRQGIAFNRMLDRINELMEGIRGVSDDIAHDLRTPLARLRGRLAALSQKAGDGELVVEIDEAIAQCDEILALFAAILRIAEVEGGSRRAAFERFDLSAVAQDIVATMAPIAEESGHELESGIDAPVLVEGDRQLLSQVMFNLIENALRHTAQGTRVRVGLMASGAQAILTVQDNGAGVPPDERDTALRRFGRLDGSRNSSGHGLGLPLVAAIARLHGGGLELGDAEPGLIAKIWLPLA